MQTYFHLYQKFMRHQKYCLNGFRVKKLKVLTHVVVNAFFDKFVEHLPQNKPYGKKLKKTWFLLVKIAPLKKLATYFKSEDICEIFQQMFLLWPNKYVTERKLDTPLWKVILSRIHFPKNHASRYVQHFQVKIAYCRGDMWQVTNCIIS